MLFCGFFIGATALMIVVSDALNHDHKGTGLFAPVLLGCTRSTSAAIPVAGKLEVRILQNKVLSSDSVARRSHAEGMNLISARANLFAQNYRGQRPL
jgi:hypothetical protein